MLVLEKKQDTKLICHRCFIYSVTDTYISEMNAVVPWYLALFYQTYMLNLLCLGMNRETAPFLIIQCTRKKRFQEKEETEDR